ncbi:glutamate--tRNA ligase, partial [Candidatus Saccharibacteria bacterium]|nr:glutamate--tRNA ligase [Candidatus Saccharibacteria bacterium]
IDRIQNSGARFDEVKILWYNGQWIRKIADEQGIDALFARTTGFWPDSATSEPDDYKKQVLSIIYDRLKTLSDLRTMTSYFFVDPVIDLGLLTDNKFLKKYSETELVNLLTVVIERLNDVSETDWTAENLQDILNQLLEQTGKKPAELFSLIRIALSYAPFSPALHLTMSTLGQNTTLARLNATRTALTNN